MEVLQVDAFTDRAYAGNPAAVVLLPTDSARRDDAEWMQTVAAEMNLSETAFVTLEESGPLGLRWFTPRVEVDLCGHATLASAHALWSVGRASEDRLEFTTRSGILGAERRGEWLTLDFPAREVTARQPPPELIESLGVSPVSCLLTGESDWLVQLPDPEDVLSLAPDFRKMAEVDCRGVTVTAGGSVARSPKADFVSRFFAPRVGIDEDPVTGSAHCALAPFWAKRLGRDELLGFQASERGGAVRVRLLGERVELAGQASTVFTGTLSAAAT
ncbi:MAG: PhzF family phenazine biosynthesis protein [Acidobacteriota bacterium]